MAPEKKKYFFAISAIGAELKRRPKKLIKHIQKYIILLWLKLENLAEEN